MADSSTFPGATVSDTKVKICGLTRRADALHAAGAGADYLGVVLVPNTPRARTAEEARELLDGIQAPSVIVVADLAVSSVTVLADRVGASVIQLHGDEPPEFVEDLRRAGPWEVWKSLRVRRLADVMEGLARFGGVVDGVLLDGWHPRKRGGTGTPFSWEEVAEVRDGFPPGVALVVAGGLGVDNVNEAVVRLRPQVVDVSSGVEESPGIKDRLRVEAFIRRVRAATAGERP
ncbi:MAG: phosphoribosylanthranilate isomerase [Gemmatimonadota bacterium]